MQRYLERHIESDLSDCLGASGRWGNVLVIPAYRESVKLLATLQALPQAPSRLLVVLVLNRPDSDDDIAANQPFREAVETLGPVAELSADPRFKKLGTHNELYLLDIEVEHGAVPAAEGVGRARKTGCDLALKWIAQGGIVSRWICSTDADAQLPNDYFRRLSAIESDCVAATYPFLHVGTPTDPLASTELYELRLHHYVLGLEYANSPYAYHTIGSCIAVDVEAYAQVRGFPPRSAAEDFYLLNKIAKTGKIARLNGECIALQARHSSRVPFGTGPAAQSIDELPEPLAAEIFYDPACFEALRCVLASVAEFRKQPAEQLIHLFKARGLNQKTASASIEALKELGIEKALEHCNRQSSSATQFARQFHQWFDGFRTLKFIHALREEGWKQLNLESLKTCEPNVWPAGSADLYDPKSLGKHVREYWGWQARANKR